MSGAYLELRNLRKEFGDFVAINNISLRIQKGEFITFLGPSGSGKSTTLYAIAGFIEPNAGDVLLNGRSLVRVSPNHRDIGMVFQRYTLFPHLTVAENIAFPLRVRRRPKAEIEAKVKEMLDLVHLTPMRDRKPAQLSGGQQQRVALARALAYDPQILLMDEPLSALDKKLREDIQAEIERIHLETGVTIIYVTHDQEEALRLSDRIVLFNHGGIEQVGTGEDLYDHPVSTFTAGFIGNSNLIDVHLQSGFPHLPDGTKLYNYQPNREGAKRLMLRPEDLFLAKEGIPVQITGRTYLGDVIAYMVRTGWGQELSVRTQRQDSNLQAYVGDTVCVGFNHEKAYIIPE
ncbi:ABC transporter ATP-binding protein [Acidocella aminolytica]|uniref:ABC transporter spermidine/putrescine permease n=1 Tax=Acidocella aminolytica 101 = DSM 11237 TaxID=1120923 RepID=A0A0D6PDI8_9PROT|nr:ABC transporter ATP-binding protein [Acidocella aminolytica]GAN79421.1 ABC transporter spermidine/putrescine permease [Acidocella aminolytica 101 = DSM 11237]GBQ43885.1 nitrate/sulfonate/bicarbonate transporter ATP-binding protein [Acidocella aminolytica 101 = DSM 11237]SHE45508.1 putative spermidine/putrescine transport system ATP-binding protein [Acidocella aminolytica 101 = DSM 11237]